MAQEIIKQFPTVRLEESILVEKLRPIAKKIPLF